MASKHVWVRLCFKWWFHNKNTLWGRYFTVWTSLVPHRFIFDWLNLHLKHWSVEIDLGRWVLVVAVINVDAYPFLAISYLTCHFEDTGIDVSGYTVLPCSNKTKLGSSNQEASPLSGKNAKLVLVPCCTWKYIPTDISGGVDILKFPWYHLFW